jgi:hypothetical protein
VFDSSPFFLSLNYNLTNSSFESLFNLGKQLCLQYDIYLDNISISITSLILF